MEGSQKEGEVMGSRQLSAWTGVVKEISAAESWLSLCGVPLADFWKGEAMFSEIWRRCTDQCLP